MAIDGVVWPGLFWPATLLSNARHLMVPVFVLLVVLALRQRRGWTAGAAAACALLAAASWVGWDRQLPSRDFSGMPALRVLTVNLGDAASDGVEAAQVLADLDVDLVLLQEVGAHHRTAMEEPLRRAFPHQLWHPLGIPGKAALSRHSITEEGWSTHPARVTLQTVRVDIPAVGPVRVMNVKLSAMASWTGLHSAGLDAILEFATFTTVHPYAPKDLRVVAGDLNSSPWSAVLSALGWKGFGSSFSRVGARVGHTFPMPFRYRYLPLPPCVRIDYILTGPGAVATAAEVGPDVGSDHLPMIATLRLPSR